MKLGTTHYIVLSTPEALKVSRINTSGNPEKDNKVDIRVMFSQKNTETGEISNGNYGYGNYELLMHKTVGQTFSVKREIVVNDIYSVTAF